MQDVNHITTARTGLGPITYLQRDSQGASKGVILTLHGAMGGVDQSDILGRTIGPDGYTYIAVSRPGYPGTPLSGRKRPEAQADLIAALLDTLGTDRVIVFAVSGGGYAALHFALRHPDRCRAQVLCSTTGGKNLSTVPFGFHVMRILARLPFFPELMRKRVEKDIEASLKRSVSNPDILARTLADTEALALFKALSTGVMTQMAARLPGTSNDIRVTQTLDYPLNRIRVPTLVVHGTDDPHLKFEDHGLRLARKIPGARLVRLEKGEHAAIFTHRSQVKTAVDEFLSSLPHEDGA